MNRSRPLLAGLLATVLLTGLCACVHGAPVQETAPVPGHVQDLPAFERFIATRPTPAQFRARYPDVLLVMPGDITTKEMRLNNSRYFADLDADGRIVGGRFM
jgi:hypothetical protein